MWCGDRRTVVGREGTVFAGLEFGGFLAVPHRISIKNQLVMAFRGIKSGIFTLQCELRPPLFLSG